MNKNSVSVVVDGFFEACKCIRTNNAQKNNAMDQAFIEMCNKTLDSLAAQLNNEDLSDEDKREIENKMLETAKMIKDVNENNKIRDFVLNIVMPLLGTCASIYLYNISKDSPAV